MASSIILFVSLLLLGLVAAASQSSVCNCDSATLTVYCDNELEMKLYNSLNEQVGPAYTNQNWFRGVQLNVDATTIKSVRATCLDIGVVGGFLAVLDACGTVLETTGDIVTVNSQETPPSSEFYVDVENSDPQQWSNLQFVTPGGSPWGSGVSPSFTSLPFSGNARWVWNNLSPSTMAFGFVFPSCTNDPTASPTPKPTPFPTPTPTSFPTPKPTPFPTPKPTSFPTPKPTPFPTPLPSPKPTTSPSREPTVSPSNVPTVSPSREPTMSPSNRPTASPSSGPTVSPTGGPTVSPSTAPTMSPSRGPTLSPSRKPTTSPSNEPTLSPTSRPTASPSVGPTVSPSDGPTFSPSRKPTTSPSNKPTLSPTSRPTASPSGGPTVSPSTLPTTIASNVPTDSPTEASSRNATSNPASNPTRAPTNPEAIASSDEEPTDSMMMVVIIAAGCFVTLAVGVAVLSTRRRNKRKKQEADILEYNGTEGKDVKKSKTLIHAKTGTMITAPIHSDDLETFETASASKTESRALPGQPKELGKYLHLEWDVLGFSGRQKEQMCDDELFDDKDSQDQAVNHIETQINPDDWNMYAGPHL